MAVKRSNLPPAEVRRSFCAEGYKNTHGAHPVEKQPERIPHGPRNDTTTGPKFPSSWILCSQGPMLLRLGSEVRVRVRGSLSALSKYIRGLMWVNIKLNPGIMDWEHRYTPSASTHIPDLVKRKFILTQVVMKRPTYTSTGKIIIFFFWTKYCLFLFYLSFHYSSFPPFCLVCQRGSIATTAMPPEASI